ncbi:MAG: SPFH/Band 7/PHB domain protein [Ruminococcaceae bacterium]|nr:SPFH/Band 7/PHB domain protein [Oscillospiraceae bacterium]
MILIVIVALLVIFLILWACVEIVPQGEARVVERLGVFRAVWGVGVHMHIPIIEKMKVIDPTRKKRRIDKYVIDLREQILEPTKQAYDFTSKDLLNYKYEAYADFGYFKKDQRYGNPYNGSKNVYSGTREMEYSNAGNEDIRDVITKDNVRMQVDVVVFYQVTDPKLYVYGVQQPLYSLQKLTITALRNIIGELELDETLTSRELINTKIRMVLDEATDSWGMKITRVEIESILPPLTIQNAMEQQATAERFKRARILEAEGNRQAEILLAEAAKQRMVLAAEAEKQKKILEAEGLLREKELEARGLKALNENAPTDAIIRLKAIQAMEQVADGQATKIIIPSQMQGLVGLANGIVEGVK